MTKIARYKNYRRENDVIIKFKAYKGRNILSTILIEGVWTAEAKHGKVVYDYTSIFLITGLQEGFEPITEGEAIEKRDDLLLKDYPYHEAFWQNYNHLIADKKQKEILGQLTPIR